MRKIFGMPQSLGIPIENYTILEPSSSVCGRDSRVYSAQIIGRDTIFILIATSSLRPCTHEQKKSTFPKNLHPKTRSFAKKTGYLAFFLIHVYEA